MSNMEIEKFVNNTLELDFTLDIKPILLGVTAHISCCCSEMQNVSFGGCMHTTQILKKYIKSTEQVQNKLVRTCSRAFSSKYLNTLQ